MALFMAVRALLRLRPDKHLWSGDSLGQVLAVALGLAPAGQAQVKVIRR